MESVFEEFWCCVFETGMLFGLLAVECWLYKSSLFCCMP
jgi:hypothetical protein